MRTIHATNVNDAWPKAITLIDMYGVPEPSRAGPVRVAPWPVVTNYAQPMQRVLFDPIRDANPIFHLHEALWMLAGQNDATWLDQFVSDFSARFAEEDGQMHGAYGYRWRRHFENPNAYTNTALDQLQKVISILQADAHSRQAVIQMWDAPCDLGVVGLKDRPCNTQIYLRIQKNALDLGVTCRSNDIVWGCYGANVVHFSILQEYLAARIGGVGVGTMTQFSWNWHMYDSAKHLVSLGAKPRHPTYPDTLPLVTDPYTFDADVRAYVSDPDGVGKVRNEFLTNTARPMFLANKLRKEHDWYEALNWAHSIKAPDWRQATVEWLQRRVKKYGKIQRREQDERRP